SLAKNEARFAMSSGWPTRFISIWGAKLLYSASEVAASKPIDRPIEVTTGPGLGKSIKVNIFEFIYFFVIFYLMEFTRMPLGPSSRAEVLVTMSRAAFEVLYTRANYEKG